MNTFNRIVLIVLCVVLVIAAVGIIGLTWTIPNRSLNWLADAVQWLDDNDGDLEEALLTTFSAFVGLVATIVLLIELIPRRGPSVQVTDLAAGSATLSAASISQRIEEAVVQVPHVSEVRADVKSKRKGVLVSLDLQVDPEANLASVTDEACQAASEVLTGRVHVTLLRPPTARLHYRELRLHRAEGNPSRRNPRPSPAAPAQEPTQLDADKAELRSSVAVVAPPELPEHPPNRYAAEEAAAEEEAVAGSGAHEPVEEKST